MRIGVALLLCLASATHAESVVVIVEGLGGNEHYRSRFASEVTTIEAAARTLVPAPSLRVFREADADRDALLAYLGEVADTVGEDDLFYLFLVGHGSYDDEEYKFNIRGPDLTDAELKSALDAIPSRNQLVVNTSSASGAAADSWTDERRIVISATRSGGERHATFFGEHFAAALFDDAADVDKNRIVTAQEAFNFADREVSALFEANGNLATEHARLDGQRAARFSLARLDAARPAIADARLAALTERRDALAGRIEALRIARDDMPAEDYQSELLGLMLELAEAEEAIENRQGALDE